MVIRRFTPLPLCLALVFLTSAFFGFRTVEAQSNLLTNGDFSSWIADNPSGFTVPNEDGTTRILSERASNGSAGTGSAYFQDSDGTVTNLRLNTGLTLTAGVRYQISIQVTSYTSGQARMVLATGTTEYDFSPVISAAGTHTWTVTVGSGTNLRLRTSTSSNTIMVFDNWTVYDLTPTATPTFTPTNTPTFTPTNTPTLTFTPTATTVFLNVVGRLEIFAGAAPAGWILCDGRSLSQAAYPDLFRAVGTTWGTASSGQFRIPDFRGRIAIGTGLGDNLTNRVLATPLGTERVTITTLNLPPHAHNLNAYVSSGFGINEGVLSCTGCDSSTYRESGVVGGGTPIAIMPPVLAVNIYIFAGVGAPSFQSVLLQLLPTSTPTMTPTPTNTPTPTPTPSSTPTPTPNFMVVATYGAVIVSETPETPGQAVAFEYRITAGDVIVSFFMFASICLSVLAIFLSQKGRQ